MTDIITTALVVTMMVCANNGQIDYDNKCTDGRFPSKTEVSILTKDADGEAVLQIVRDDKAVFRLRADGTIKKGDSFKLDEAAKLFWAAVAETLFQKNISVGIALESLRVLQFPSAQPKP